MRKDTHTVDRLFGQILSHVHTSALVPRGQRVKDDCRRKTDEQSSSRDGRQRDDVSDIRRTRHYTCSYTQTHYVHTA